MKLASLLLVAIALIAFPRPNPTQDTKKADPKAAKKELPKEERLGPDSMVHDDVPKGKLEGPFLFKSKILDRTVRKYWVYVPAQYTPDKPACVLVFQDGARAINPNGA